MMRVVLILSLILIINQIKAQKNPQAEMIDTVFVQNRVKENHLFSTSTTHKLLANDISNCYGKNTATSLSSIPGILVQQTNLGGGSPYLRGLTGNQVLLLVDGIRMNNSIYRYGPNQYLNTIDWFNIESVEVGLGTGSVSYGSDALGGVVLLNTRPILFNKMNKKPVFLINGITRLMNVNSEISQNLSMKYSRERFGLWSSFTYRTFNNYKAGGNIGLLNPIGYDELNAYTKLSWQSKIGLWVFHSQINHQNQVPVYHKLLLEKFLLNEMTFQNRQLYYLRNTKSILHEKLQVESTIGYQCSDELRKLLKIGSNLTTRERDKVQTYFLTSQLSFLLNKNIRSVIGVEVYHDIVNSYRQVENHFDNSILGLRGLYPNGSSNNQLSIFQNFIGSWNRMSGNLGYRIQSNSLNIKDVDVGNVVDNNRAFVFSTGLNYQVLAKKINKLFFYVNVNSGFRAPNIDDLGTLGIVDFRYEIPQYSLKPEYSLSKEIGVKYENQKLKANLSIYHNNLSGIISRIKVENDSINGYPVYRKENIESMEIWGVETKVQMTISEKLKVVAGCAYIQGDNLTRNEPMRRIPPFNGSIRFDYLFKNIGKFSTKRSLYIEYVSAHAQNRLAAADISDNRIGKNGTPGFNQFNIGIRLTRNTQVIECSMQNLSNQIVKIHGSGIYQPGRSIVLVIKF